MADMAKGASDAMVELKKMGIPMEAFRKSVRGTAIDEKLLAENIKRTTKRIPIQKEINRYAQMYNKHLSHQRMLEEDALQATEKRQKAGTFRGSIDEGLKNLKERVTAPFKLIPNLLKAAPTLLGEGIKERLGKAFSAEGIIGRSAKRLVKSVFSKKALFFGPLGAMAEFGAQGKKKDQRGFVSGGGEGGPLGALGKSLNSFGGMLKWSLKALGPMALLMKALTPVIQTLEWALRPLIAPLQKMLQDVVLQMVPFFRELGGLMKDLADELLPPLMDAVKMLMPPLMELFKSILPPLVKILKLTVSWFTKVSSVILKIFGPVITWLAEVIAGVAEKIAGFFEWIGDWLGIDAAADIGGSDGRAGSTDQEKFARPKTSVNPEGESVAGEVRAMTITEAGGNKAFQRWTEPRGLHEPIQYDAQREIEALDRKAEAMRSALEDRPSALAKMDPEEQAEPVVKALKQIQHTLMAMPKRIGQETKAVTLSDFSAVTA